MSLRLIRVRDWRTLQKTLIDNRKWLRRWEATSPTHVVSTDMKANIRLLLANARAGLGIPFVVEYGGEFAGQLSVSSISSGSMSMCSIGYWISQKHAGHGATPTAVALVADYCFSQLGLHRVEICIRPENAASLRVVTKLGFRYEGLRKRYIHINGDWRDHFSFALVAEDVPEGVLNRWVSGNAPESAAAIPQADLDAATRSMIS